MAIRGTVRLVAGFVLAALTACGGDSRPPAVTLGDAFGEAFIVADPYDSGALYPPAANPVPLAAPSRPLDAALGRSPAELVVTYGNGGGRTVFGEIAWKTVRQPDGTSTTLSAVRRAGAAERFVGLANDGTVWAVRDDEVAAKIGETRFMDVALEPGRSRQVRVMRVTRQGAPWVGVVDGTLVALDDEQAAARPIGEVGWRLAPLPGGGEEAVLMSRASGEDARWCGRFRGFLYCDP